MNNPTLGGNPTRPLELGGTHVVLAVEVVNGEWAGVYPFRTWTRATRALQPVTSTDIDEAGWSVWSCSDGRLFWVCRDEVA